MTLVERLRSYAKDQGGWLNIDDTCEEAADRIEALEAELAKAREALERAAQVAYRVCAETRHVTLGEKAATAIRALSQDKEARE